MADQADTETIEPELDDKSWRAKRLKPEMEKRQAAEAKISELTDRLEQLESRDKTDVERLTKELERTQAKAQAFEQKHAEVVAQRERDQRAGWVQAAAAKANFHDPGVAARMAELDTVEDAASAEKLVKQLAKENAWLVRQDTEGARLHRVGKEGDVVDPKPNEQGEVSEEQRALAFGEILYRGLTGGEKSALAERVEQAG